MINQVLDPGIIWLKADSPYKTLKDLVEAAKKTPKFAVQRVGIEAAGAQRHVIVPCSAEPNVTQ